MHRSGYLTGKGGPHMAVYVIAEAGSTHEGSEHNATLLVNAAMDAGADAIKFQYWSSPERMRLRRHAHGDTSYDIGSIDPVWLPSLRACVHTARMEFMCTAYCREDIAVIAPYVDKFKVSSFEAQDTAFVRAHARYHKDMVISTGLSRPDTFFHGAMAEKWRSFLSDLAPARVHWLHCVSAYPTPLREANIACVAPLGG